MEFELLSRDEFRESVFERDKYKCIKCLEKAVDAHHIIERRLFTDGGYYLNNGASLCTKHHLQAESTILSCEEIRELIGIDHFPIPEHFYSDIDYDKWGNIILPSGDRLIGELYYDESVQKIIQPVLNRFSKYIKYPRTYHLSWSVMGKDDRQLNNQDNFKGKRVIVTLKKDGENTTMYNDKIHARSINSGSHPSRNYVKGLWAQISYLIDDNMRICGENLYAKHTIKYDNLLSYFYIFSIWIDNVCLSWDETKEYAEIFGFPMVETIYDGIYDEEKIKAAFKPYENTEEGYVIRLADDFTYADFRKSVAKYVKPSFRQSINDSHGHWISKPIIPNELLK